MGHPPLEIVITLITSLASTIISAVIGYIVYKMRKHSEKLDAREAQRKAEQKAYEEKREADNQALKVGLQSVLRDKLIYLMQKSEQDGYVKIYVLQNVETMYAAYHNLGGNGLLTTLHERFEKLPHVPEEAERNAADV